MNETVTNTHTSSDLEDSFVSLRSLPCLVISFSLDLHRYHVALMTMAVRAIVNTK